MQLVKLGDRFINLDCVYQVSFEETKGETLLVATLDVTVSTSTYPDQESNDIEPAGMRVFGKNAEVLRYWLQNHSDDAGKSYDNFLALQERLRLAGERERNFQEFTASKDLNQEAKYSYRYWLQNQEEESDSESQPGEESFAAWRAWHIAQFEEAVKNAMKAASIPADRIEEFKEFCKETGNYQPQYYDGLNFLRGERAAEPLF